MLFLEKWRFFSAGNSSRNADEFGPKMIPNSSQIEFGPNSTASRNADDFGPKMIPNSSQIEFGPNSTASRNADDFGPNSIWEDGWEKKTIWGQNRTEFEPISARKSSAFFPNSARIKEKCGPKTRMVRPELEIWADEFRMETNRTILDAGWVRTHLMNNNHTKCVKLMDL